MSAYLETDNPRVLAFRFRVDPSTNLDLAAELRRRADALEADIDPNVPDAKAIERAERLVNERTVGFDEWTKARLIRRIARTGECLWHACWVLRGSTDGRGCDCASCTRERET